MCLQKVRVYTKQLENFKDFFLITRLLAKERSEQKKSAVPYFQGTALFCLAAEVINIS